MDDKTLAKKLLASLEETHMLDGLTRNDEIGAPLLEIFVEGDWAPTDAASFRSWTGRRMINGEEHHGPVFLLGAPDGAPPYAGRRTCFCPTCQEHVAPQHRPN